jgi:putative ABC transport system permease protein
MLKYHFSLAVRHLRRSPGLTVLMVLAMAVGIGATMTTLTVMYLLSGDPLPGRSQHIYYAQVDGSPKSKGREPPDLLDYQSASDLWAARGIADQQALVALGQVKVAAQESAHPPLMSSMVATTSDFFSMFGVPFVNGSGWRPEDEKTRRRIVVISSALNNKLFNGRNSVGSFIQLGQTQFEIVGVMGPWRPAPLFYAVRGGRFAKGDTSSFYGKPDDVFVPLPVALDAQVGTLYPYTCWSSNPDPGHMERSPCVWLGLWVQLSDAGKVAAYQSLLRNYASEQKEAGRIVSDTNTRLRSLLEWLDFNRVIPSDVKMQMAIALAFLASCLANVVSLLLAKLLRHQADLGLRRALGATRGSIFVQCMAESLVLGLLGCVGGVLVAGAGLWLVRIQDTPYSDLATLNLPMLGGTVALSLLVSLLAGLVPAARAALIPPGSQIKQL